MSVGMTLLLVTIAFAVIGWYKGRAWWTLFQTFRAWEQQYRQGVPVAAITVPMPPFPMQSTVQPAAINNSINHLKSFDFPAPTDMTILDGAARALKNPPADLRISIAELDRRSTQARYGFPLGWFAGAANPALVSAAFVGDVNHILVTGLTDSGKDNMVISWLLAITYRYRPEQVQIAFVDGKNGLSLNGWHTKQHTFLFAKSGDQLAGAMDALVAERKRREQILWDAQCEKWEEYPGSDMPLLIVYVSELMLVQSAVGKTSLGDWLNEELSGCRSAGIRYIIGTQNATKLDTRWRSQIGLHVAGYQQSQDGDEPNTGLSPKALRALGTTPANIVVGVPPSELPVPPSGAGVFTLVQGRRVLTVRAPYVDRAQRLWWLQQLPDRADPQELLHQFRQTTVVSMPRFQPGEVVLPNDVVDAQPVIAFAAVQESSQDQGYDASALADVLASLRQRDLSTNEVFITACVAAYKRHKSYSGVIREFWGSYSGGKEQAVKDALANADRKGGEAPMLSPMASAA